MLRRWGYHRGVLPTRRLSIPVISVGNLTVGGTGKTPTTMLLARLLRQQGKRVVVLSRGYKGSAPAPVNVVSDGERVCLNPLEAGDEPFLLAQRLPGVPVLTATDRARAGTYAQDRFSPDVAILDDGFQHMRLHRDVEIVLLDQEYPFGNGYLLPRGPLREPPRTRARAHLALVTGSAPAREQTKKKLEAHIRRHHASIPIFYAHYVPRALIPLTAEEELPCDHVQGKSVVALAGIGRPRSFSGLLEALGARVIETRFFPDHHQYRTEDLEIPGNHAVVVTTEKDAVKLKSLDLRAEKIFILSVALVLEEEEAFMEALKKYLPSRD